MVAAAAGLAVTYTPDKDIRIHEENAIKLLCSAFQSHESGLPEWVKNAADEYARRKTSDKDRVIVVLTRNGTKANPGVIGCLDFGGMTSGVIEQKFRHWADPEAAYQDKAGSDIKVQGGHGNGGKCYMTQMFEQQAYFHTVRDGLGSRYGTVAGSVRFGYFPDRETGRDFDVDDVAAELDRALAPFSLSLSALPTAAQHALASSRGFTVVAGFGPRDYTSKIPTAQLVDQLRDHPQMLTTLQLCKVYVVTTAGVVPSANPLELDEIPPMVGHEAPRICEIPDVLVDPATKAEVSTTENGALPRGALTLRTSEAKLWRKRGRHVITYWNEDDYLGSRPIGEFAVTSAFRERLYGTCSLAALAPCKQNDRGHLAISPLSRAIEAYVGRELDGYCKEFEALERRDHDRQEREAVAEMNRALDEWKNQVLDDVMNTMWGAGDGPEPPPPPPPLPTGVPARLDLRLGSSRAGVGVALRPRLVFFDADDQRIRPTPYRWVSSDPNVALVDEDLNILNTFSAGQVTISAETLGGKLKSAEVVLDVVLIYGIEISPSTLEVPLGSRRGLTANCTLESDETAGDVYLMWQESDSGVAAVSTAGIVYGRGLGSTDITAMDDRCIARDAAQVEVVAADGGGDDPGKGSGYPKVLISEYEKDPITDEDVSLSEDDPPVHQRPQDVDYNIWWINSAAPLARLYLDTGAGYGYESAAWRMYHIERYIDVIVQIALTGSPESEESLHVGDWILRWGERAAEIQRTAVEALRLFIDSGDLASVLTK